MLKVGLFIPIGNNGWYVSETTPQYKPTFDLNREIVQRAERHGLDFALSMIKLRGFGGKTEYWDYNLESFSLMAGLAAVTRRIELFASVAVLTIPPAIVARMAVTIDSIAPGRFGVNIVSGWGKDEYSQMNLWPGDDYFGYRYDYSTEYVTVMRELWETGHSDFKGKHFQMEDCRLLPHPSRHIPVVSAGQSDRGMRFVAENCDYAFVTGGPGGTFNQPQAAEDTLARFRAAIGPNSAKKALVLVNIVAAETDAAAMAKWEHYREGIDHVAANAMAGRGSTDLSTDANSQKNLLLSLQDSNEPTVVPTFCGSYETVARQLDQLAEMPGVSGVLLTFDDFLRGTEQFGHFIQPLMKSRSGITRAAA